jgi:hypothetical protein
MLQIFVTARQSLVSSLLAPGEIMSPSTCSCASLRLLTSVLLAASIANAVALPHQVLDHRTANALSNELLTTSDVVAAVDAVTNPESDPDKKFENVEQILRDHTDCRCSRTSSLVFSDGMMIAPVMKMQMRL